jgi:acetoacetate decarboxylase
MMFLYETDEEAAQAIVPEGIEISSPATVNVTVFRAPFTTLGSYNSAMVRINCMWQGQPKGYVCYQIVTGDAAMAAGREIWGYPKKMGHVVFSKENQMITATVERPKGYRLCTASVRPEVPLDEECIVSLTPTLRPPNICLKVIPNPVEGEGHSVAQLIEPGGVTKIVELWRGTGLIHFDTPSPIDPWHKLVVKRIIGSYYSKFDTLLTYGSVLKNY